MVVLARRVSLAQGLEQVAQLVVGYRQIALVVGAVGFCRDQPLANLQGLLVVLARRVPLAQGPEQVAQLVVGYRQIALVVGAVGFCRDATFQDCHGLLIAFKRFPGSPQLPECVCLIHTKVCIAGMRRRQRCQYFCRKGSNVC